MERVDKPTLIDVAVNNEELVCRVEQLYRLSDIAVFALYKQIIEASHDGE